MARTGRRPGDSGTREAILEAARRTFAESGYDRATIRGVARLAGVDPALVHHYFGTKQALFVAAMRFPVDPADALAPIFGGDQALMGERIAGLFVTLWDAAANRNVLIGLVRSAVADEQAARLLREFVASAIFAPLAGALGRPDAELRATLVASQLVGLAMARYIIRIEPLASAPSHTVVAAIAPTLQRYLTGEMH